ncbi:hypothetical protein TNCV_2842081 [Trichonephila clavipes]|uniref:Endonuclease-reverse transcriptase n=1 Tax=Trichonephila clavipes TaxID=2585209 RepID=A0A8X6V396_TRICX|nr:hypothetical protein TNCV_2842081 [Trichonephila clavipes]
MISIYERKILRIIFGGIQENGTWRRRSNLELYQSYKEFDIVNFIKVQRIKWAGHVVRMEWKTAPLKKVLNAQLTGTRRKGRPNLRRINDLERGLLVLRTNNWKNNQEEGWPGKGFLRRLRSTLGCRATEEGRKEGMHSFFQK